ncbi:acyltransferase family protein [Vibrio ziniensis]|uniref:Acyltransferase n=1 Tax=Vibrio ziniensis TaxID=2711221 RepID=A0A6G7CMH3_9VIBR|nr:acyltransferase [Vibrio ziniensis]QIH43295.1 acyltransferase [Vibrio ziniensis]
MDKEISDRIWVTRFLMIIGIIVLHLPPYQPLKDVGTMSEFDYIKAFFTFGVFRATIPVLTAISGYIIFTSSLHLSPQKLIKNKVNSILIPLILWNLPLAIAVYFIQKHTLFDYNFSVQLFPFELINWLGAVTSLYGSAINYPTGFLRDLFVLSILSPLLWPLLKTIPYCGFIVVLVIYYFNLDGGLISRNSMLVSFYLGALAAHKEWDLTALDKYAPLLLAIFLSIAAGMIAYKIDNREPLRLISPILVWPSMSLIMGTNIGNTVRKFTHHSFFTFLAHGPLILMIWLIYQKLFPNGPYFIYWLTAPIITVILSIIVNHNFKKFSPKLHAFALGGR